LISSHQRCEQAVSACHDVPKYQARRHHQSGGEEGAAHRYVYFCESLAHASYLFALVGGSSGIGLAAAKIFAQRGADVLILDLNSPLEALPSAIEYRKCDISQWAELKSAFLQAGNIDIAVANAGVSEDRDYFADTFDEEGELLEPAYPVMEVNLKAVFNFVKLSLSHFRKRKSQGSIVITSSATAYSPEQSLPVYSACKLAVSHSRRLLFL
jgi:NAD(P)-dependent dehydrogenase (short-subunit alcohol dehydrogenase family)